jgi:hypothetical protein
VSGVLSIDPGRDKCGIAVVTPDGTIFKQVVTRGVAAETILRLIAAHSPDAVIMGEGTGSKDLHREIADLSPISIELVAEAFSTQRARVRFFDENPPRGLRRLVPRGLLTPDRPYDDYVAVILAEDFLRRNS